MEVLGLDVKRKHVCQKHSEGGRNILGGVGAEIGRRLERRLAALSRVLYTHYDLSFRVDPALLFELDGSEQAILRNGVCTFARTLPVAVNATSSVPPSMTIYRRPSRLAPKAPSVRFRSSTNIPVPWRASAWVGALVLPLVMFGI